MIDRDKYVERLKAEIDRWNGQLGKLESKLETVRSRIDRQIGEARVRRDDLEKRVQQIGSVSGDAWLALREGAEKARKSLTDAIAKARAKFT